MKVKAGGHAMTRNPLTPAAPRRFSTSLPAGTVYTNEDGHVVKMTYLYAGEELYDNVTGDEHGLPMHRFIVWQGGPGGLVFRTRLTKGEIERKKLVEQRRGLSPVQQASVARMLFTHWESDEYRSIEIHNLTKGAEK
jgi:hypothetical protein